MCRIWDGQPVWRSDMHIGEFDRQVRYHDDFGLLRYANIGNVLISHGSFCKWAEAQELSEFEEIAKKDLNHD
jgi:hypothetical protein